MEPLRNFMAYKGQMDMDKGTEFWREQMDGAKFTAYPKPENVKEDALGTKVLEYSFDYPKDAPDTAITMGSVFRAAYATVLALSTDTEDVTFGMTVTGRQAPVQNIESVAAPLLSRIAVRQKLDMDQSIMTFLKKVQNQAAQMVPFEHYGVQNVMKVSEDAKNACRFTNLLGVMPAQHLLPTDEEKQDMAVPDPVMVRASESKWSTGEALDGFYTYPLTFLTFIYNDHADLALNYDGTTFSEKQMLELAENFKAVVSQMLKDPTASLGSVQLAHRNEI